MTDHSYYGSRHPHDSYDRRRNWRPSVSARDERFSQRRSHREEPRQETLDVNVVKELGDSARKLLEMAEERLMTLDMKTVKELNDTAQKLLAVAQELIVHIKTVKTLDPVSSPVFGPPASP
jgi:hypothetical protein